MRKESLAMCLCVFLLGTTTSQCFAESEFSIMTFNLRHSGEAKDLETGNVWEGKRDQQVINAILSKMPDILAVQEMSYDDATEVDPRDYVRSSLQSWYKVYKGLGGSPKDIFYNGTKFEVELESSGADYIWPDSRSEICPDSNGLGGGRSITWATLTDQVSGDQIFVVNAHLHHEVRDTQVRISQLKCIRSHIEERSQGLPVVLMGDLNSLYGGYEVCALEEGFNINQQTLFDASGRNYEATFNGFCVECKLDTKLDYIFLRGLKPVGEPEIVRYSYYDELNQKYRWPSDHFPVYVKLNYHTDISYTNLEQSSCNRSGFSLFW